MTEIPSVLTDDTRPRLPSGVELSPLDPAFADDPYAVLERLRGAAPVYWDAGFVRWFITGFDEAHELLRSKDLSSNPLTAAADSYSAQFAAGFRHASMEDLLGAMLWQDDPQHRRLRSLVSRSFGVVEVEARRERIRYLAEHLLDDISGEHFDVIQGLANPLPVRVISEMFGLEVGLHENFKRCSEDLVRGVFNPLRSAQETQLARSAAQELRRDFLRLIDARKQNPGDDLVSRMLVVSDEDSQPLSDGEILAQCLLLLVAGNVTTTDFIGNAVRLLLTHPQQLAALRAEPVLIGNAMEEVLRYDSPVAQATRVVARDMSFAGCPLRRGQTVQISLSGVNRDPRACPEPDRFDIRRADLRHQSFGGGKHTCLGAYLARVEAQEAVGSLLRRYPQLQLLERPLQFHKWPGLRGTHELWVRGTTAVGAWSR